MSSVAENKKILIVDDEPEIREGYRRYLKPERLAPILSSRGKPSDVSAEPAGLLYDDFFELTWATTGDEALALVRSEREKGNRFVGAFVDVRMPGKIDGLQFIQKAWELDPDLLMVVVTAYQDRSVDEIMRLFGQGFQDQWDYLNKPFTGGEIVQKARSLVSLWNRRERERSYLKTIRDQQERLVAQEQIAAVGRLAHSVGHDLGNVLQQILTKLECEEPHRNAELIEAVELGANICQDLLTFARRSRDVVAPSQVKLAAPIEKALRLLRHEFAKKDITVDAKLDAKASVLAHESRLVQVFVNVLTNAVYALKTGGKIEVRCTADAPVVEIRDNGPGIAPEVLARIFEPLFTTKGESGSGLGLPVCRNIVESYGGKISVQSKVGEGTAVRIEFAR